MRAGDASQGQRPFASQAIIEVAGKLRFDLPGIPLFPGLSPGLILKPTLDWTVATDRAGRMDAELAYISGGFDWSADYNIVQGPSNTLDIIGGVPGGLPVIGKTLGMPLPKGRVRFYRRDTDGRLEFTGEDSIDHTPRNGVPGRSRRTRCLTPRPMRGPLNFTYRCNRTRKKKITYGAHYTW